MYDKLPSGITTQQFEAYKMVSGEHDGLTMAEAAKKMQITPRSVQRLLERMEEILPELFPLLTKDEAKVSHHFQFGGDMPVFSPDKLANIMRSLKKKGKNLGKGTPPSTVSYENHMDGKVKRKF